MDIFNLPLPCLMQLISYLNTSDIINLFIATYDIQPKTIKSTTISDIILNQK